MNNISRLIKEAKSNTGLYLGSVDLDNKIEFLNQLNRQGIRYYVGPNLHLHIAKRAV